MRAFPLLSLSVALILTAARPGSAQLASLIYDLAVPDPFGDGSMPSSFGRVGERAVFRADHPLLDDSLWATDGTPEGTELLATACADCSFNPGIRFWQLASTSRLLFLLEGGGSSGRLWRTDGTRGGTFPVRPAGDPSFTLSDLTAKAAVMGDRVFFAGTSAGTGEELWVTDGTTAGTRVVREVTPGPTGAFNLLLMGLGERVLFIAGGVSHLGLWISDGSAAGTVEIADLGNTRVEAASIVSTSNGVFFVTIDFGTSAPRLWASDGTPGGTRVVSDLRPLWLRGLGDRAVFLADDGSHGLELWSSNGSPGGTTRITNFAAPSPFPEPTNGHRLIGRLEDRIVFVANPDGDQRELWATDAHRVRMSRLADLGPFDGCSVDGSETLEQTGSRLVFLRCLDSSFELSLWGTDGSGIEELNDRLDGTEFSGLFTVPGAAGEVFFVDDIPAHGFELFSTDGTPSGTRRRTQLPSGTFGSVAEHNFPEARLRAAASLGGTLVFSARAAGEQGFELWAVDATPETTRLLADIRADSTTSEPRSVVAADDGAFFLALGVGPEPPSTRTGLWHVSAAGDAEFRLDLSDAGCFDGDSARLLRAGPRTLLGCSGRIAGTDGTLAGTEPLLVVNHAAAQFSEVAEHGGFTYIGGSVASGELWRTDGTPGGSQQVLAEIDLLNDQLEQLTAAGGGLYFVTPGLSHRVFKSNGTLAGTQALVSLDYPVEGFWELAAGVCFFARGDDFRLYLWCTDGTAAGTQQSIDLTGLGIAGLAEENRVQNPATGELYFVALHEDRWGLWKTDGTTAGTVVLRGNFGIGIAGQLPLSGLEPWAGALYFSATDGAHGRELWRSDGTPGGTALFADLAPGPVSSSPTSLTVAGDRLFFQARRASVGRELWVSDGTPEGTRLVHDIAPGPLSSSPADLTAIGNRLYFTADDGLHGRELWSLNLDETGCVPSERALCLQDGRFRVEADWRDFQGNEGRGTAVALTPDTGYFWFFTPSNVEAVLKVLDGRGLNDHFWTFYGALSTVEYNLTVTDAETGVSRRYYNPPGNLASRADTASFGPNGASLERYTPPAEEESDLAEIFRHDSLDVLSPRGSCAPASNRLCLRNGRFAVEASWRDFQGNTGTGTAVEITGDTGTFWFFRPENLEVILKVLDGTELNGKHWVFYGALSSVEYTLTVTDTSTGAVKTYFNPLGRLASVADTGAF